MANSGNISSSFLTLNFLRFASFSSVSIFSFVILLMCLVSGPALMFRALAIPLRCIAVFLLL